MQCIVHDAGKLPGDSGGEEALCATLLDAVRGREDVVFVEVDVRSAFMLKTVVIMTDGRRLPEITVASSDRPLGASSFRLLATSVSKRLGEVGGA